MPNHPLTDHVQTGDTRIWGLSLPQLLLVAGFVVAAAAAGLTGALQLQRMQERALRAEVTRATDERMRLLRSSTLRCLEALHAMASFLEQSPELTREGFRRFVHGPLQRLPELQAFEWIPRVPHAQRAHYEAAGRRDGQPGFVLTELTARGSVEPAGERAVYHPVFFAEPAHNNKLALGLDVGSHPERSQALQRALNTKAPAASAPVRLAQEHAAHEFGMLVFAPVMQPAQQTPRGYALAVLRMSDFVRPAFAQLTRDGFAVRVWDREQPNQILFAQGDTGSGAFGRQAVLELAGRDLVLWFVPTQRFLQQQLSHAPWLFAGTGLLLGLLIAAHVARSMRYTHEVERRGLERAAANQRLQAEIAIRKQAQEEAARAREAQAQFLANVSHEIRTPLNAITGYAQILQRCEPDQALRAEALSTIGQSGQHLLTLLDEVIDLTKIEAGHVQLRPCDFDLHALLESVAAMLRPKCEQKGLALHVSLCEGPSWLRADAGKLRQVLLNLLGNAVKFTERGEVRLCATRRGERVELEVTDTGIGIAAAEQARVFATFYQADPSRAEGGAGLGLTISRRLVELLGGELSLRSELGRGSSFSFSIELNAPLSVAPAEQRLDLPGSAPCSALVVDDRASNREVLQHMLAAIGCSVCCAPSGQAALALAEQQRFDLIFLDLLMPGLDGIDTARALRARGQRAKVIAFSASALDRDCARYRALGFDGFLPKPFRLQALQDCLREWLRPPPPVVPGPLLLRIRAAAELYQVTRLRQALTELAARGERERLWSERLRAHAQRYEMAELLGLLAQLPAAKEDAA